MAVLTQTSHEPSTLQLQQLSTYNTHPLLTRTSTSTLLAMLTPALTNTLLLFSYLRLFLRSYALTTAILLLNQTFKITRALMWHSIAISHMVVRKSLRTSTHVTMIAYKRAEPVRQKLFFEFMVFILNPGLGHGLCVLLFWPGWVLLWPVLIGYLFLG